MFITIYSTFNNPWASTEAGQWVEKQLGSSSWDGSMSGVLLASNMILWVGTICGYSWVKFLSNISMLHHWTIAFFPILGIFKGLMDHAPTSMGTSPSEFNTTQEIDEAKHDLSVPLFGTRELLIGMLLIPVALFLHWNLPSARKRLSKEIEKSAQKQDPKNPFPDRPKRSLDSQFISTVLNGIQTMTEKWEI